MELTRVEDPQVWFVPDIHGNRELPESERFAVLIRPLTRQELVAAKREPVTKLQQEMRDASEMLSRFHEIRDAVLRCAVLEVRNLHCKRVKGGVVSFVDVVDVDGLLEIGADGILDQCFAAIEDHSVLAEGLLGKSAWVFDCSAALNPACGDGDAESADAQKTAKSQPSNYSEHGDAKRTNPVSTSTSRPSSPDALGVS